MKKHILIVGLSLIGSLNAADTEGPLQTSCPLEILGLASQDNVKKTDNVYSFPNDAPFLYFTPCTKEAPKKSRAVARLFAAGIVIMHVQYEREESYDNVKSLFIDNISDSDLLQARIQADAKFYERILDSIKKDYSPFKKNQPQLDDVQCAIIWYSLHAESRCTYSDICGAITSPEFETRVNRLLSIFNSAGEVADNWSRCSDEPLSNKIKIEPASISQRMGTRALIMQQNGGPLDSIVTCNSKDLFAFLNDKNKNLLDQEAQLLHTDLQTRKPKHSEDTEITLTPQDYGKLDDHQALSTELLIDRLKAKQEQANAKRGCNIL